MMEPVGLSERVGSVSTSLGVIALGETDVARGYWCGGGTAWSKAQGKHIVTNHCRNSRK